MPQDGAVSSDPTALEKYVIRKHNRAAVTSRCQICYHYGTRCSLSLDLGIFENESARLLSHLACILNARKERINLLFY